MTQKKAAEQPLMIPYVQNAERAQEIARTGVADPMYVSYARASQITQFGPYGNLVHITMVRFDQVGNCVVPMPVEKFGDLLERYGYKIPRMSDILELGMQAPKAAPRALPKPGM